MSFLSNIMVFYTGFITLINEMTDDFNYGTRPEDLYDVYDFIIGKNRYGNAQNDERNDDNEINRWLQSICSWTVKYLVH